MPTNTSSAYYNYKHTFSAVLLALVDQNYKFLLVDVGCNGRISDGGVFQSSTLYKALKTGEMNLPLATPLQFLESGVSLP